MALVGADVDQLRTLARTLTQAADRLDGMTREVTVRLSSTPWTGPDAERHRSQWNGQSLGLARGVIGALRSAADVVERNATEQDHASEIGGQATSRSDGGATSPQGGSGNVVTDTLAKLLDVGAMANDFANLGAKGFTGLTGDVLSGAGVVTSLTTLVEGISASDDPQTAGGVIGLAGAALGRANPALGIAASAAQMYGGLTLPTSEADYDGVFAAGARSMFGKEIDQLSEDQQAALNNRYDGAWGVANMISDSMDSKMHSAGQFFGKLFGG